MFVLYVHTYGHLSKYGLLHTQRSLSMLAMRATVQAYRNCQCSQSIVEVNLNSNLSATDSSALKQYFNCNVILQFIVEETFTFIEQSVLLLYLYLLDNPVDGGKINISPMLELVTGESTHLLML